MTASGTVPTVGVKWRPRYGMEDARRRLDLEGRDRPAREIGRDDIAARRVDRESAAKAFTRTAFPLVSEPLGTNNVVPAGLNAPSRGAVSCGKRYGEPG